jgi:chromosome segregation ATPase
MDLVTIIVGILALITAAAAIEYYRLLRRVQKEYDKARSSVEDVLLSVNRQFKRESERLELVAYKVETNSAKVGAALKKSEETEKAWQTAEVKANMLIEEKEEMLTRLDELESKLRDVTTSQESVTTKVSKLEEQAKQAYAIPEANAEAVIPIRRDRALAPLTETEIAALEFLASEGSKTAPEIKWKIRLSREHTARLMKKLYESGYLERDTNKIPFKYSIKKEMQDLLRKKEMDAA